MIRHYVKRPAGFTLVELMLSMAFIGALLLAIAVTSMQIMGTYTKGLTLREVNQAGRTITEDIQRTIASSIPFAVDPPKKDAGSDATDSMYVRREGDKRGGRLCTGAYTYAWNYGDELSGDGQHRYNRYVGESPRLTDASIRLVKVSDAGGTLCNDPEMYIPRAAARELLSGGDRNLAVQELTVSSSSRDDSSGQALYAITLVLGTNDQAQLNAANSTCLPPNQGSGSEDFCAINQFNIIARAGNQSGSL